MTLHRFVVDAAATAPDRPAVVGPSGSLTYRALDDRANALASGLRARGVGRGDRVVLWADKSPELVAAMQAVLRLGAAYVPADRAVPAARVAAMVRDCAARAVVTGAEAVPRLSDALPSGTHVLDLAAEFAPPAAPVDEAVTADALAYILYTSGSTGKPKGVRVSHGNATAFVDWAVAELRATPADRFANHAPLTFDLSVLDLYAAFASGASVHLVPNELAYAPRQLVDFLHEERISVWYSVPSALTLMMRDGGLLERPAPDGLRAILFAGEPFAVDHVRRLSGWTGARLLNLYGPTETNVCTFHEVEPADLRRDRPVPIGRATCGDRVWARRPDGSVAEPGEEGELLVDGPTVMLGYWGHPPHRGPYPTGDLVRVLPDGAFEYLGRRDHMVKVRGHRVELGEVEAVLATHPDVAEAVATVVGTGMESRLAAFVLPRPGREPGVLALKRHIARRLPRYMVVDEVHRVAHLPRTRNGKIDRSALAARAAGPTVPAT
ncbi:amino acid adenylation domain-containing protein [Streptomyces hainanensis]|uniref:Amino acid adenylation domain-containing protein n=1 Tax=Streptomyces hainanensis TaxID=402648 RepID=A0A4R4TAR4_9ACTN|nr:amino acid adenylation domain-containing protein [Streptomyces hainanensis]TDC72594.1 amino acid adenylation domain-containing protein [Streptomyces hainanensis]